MDMRNLEVTDIPKSDPIPIKNINDHLNNYDFFDVENHPTSRFEISNIEKLTFDSLTISGNLTLKRIVKKIKLMH